MKAAAEAQRLNLEMPIFAPEVVGLVDVRGAASPRPGNRCDGF
jgi:hypothetical protein